MASRDNSFVFVGKKPLMAYVLAAMMQINTESREVVIKARGQAISRAVDVAEVLRNKFVPNAKVKDIKIYTETLAREDGSPSNVSSIEITMIREGEHASVPGREKRAPAAAPPVPVPK
jgi:DNA-binding protein